MLCYHFAARLSVQGQAEQMGAAHVIDTDARTPGKSQPKAEARGDESRREALLEVLSV